MTADQPQLRILTQNMFMRPPLIKNNKSDWKDARLDYFIEHILPNYDVVCLQEMFEFASYRRSRLLEAANKLGFNYYVASERQFLWNVAIDGGLVILSRHPIVASDSIEYQRGMGPDWIPKKGALYAKLAIHAQSNQKVGEEAATHVHILTTHTQASYGEVIITQPDVKRRLAQLHEFHNFLERLLPKHRAPGEPVLLTGDFNVDSRSHVLSDPTNIKYEREVEDGVQTSDEGAAMMAILEGHGIDPKLLGPENQDSFKGDAIIEFHDSLKERLGYHPVTFGNTIVDEQGSVHPRETVLTTRHDNEVMHSIDYVLWHNPDNTQQKNGVLASLADVGVTPNFTPDQEFTQISDHYGVSAEVRFSFS
ncbi:Endonuclease/exonuclease/phosphatase [Martensiomyces pterosporus]|nr:Endonuclease/exonuclease/phosphatase [Martensiomyces pterosporus]